jgi:hypothetical protein
VGFPQQLKQVKLCSASVLLLRVLSFKKEIVHEPIGVITKSLEAFKLIASPQSIFMLYWIGVQSLYLEYKYDGITQND